MLRCRSERGVGYLCFCSQLILRCNWKCIKIWFYVRIKGVEELSQKRLGVVRIYRFLHHLVDQKVVYIMGEHYDYERRQR